MNKIAPQFIYRVATCSERFKRHFLHDFRICHAGFWGAIAEERHLEVFNCAREQAEQNALDYGFVAIDPDRDVMTGYMVFNFHNAEPGTVDLMELFVLPQFCRRSIGTQLLLAARVVADRWERRLHIAFNKENRSQAELYKILDMENPHIVWSSKLAKKMKNASAQTLEKFKERIEEILNVNRLTFSIPIDSTAEVKNDL